MKRFWFFAFAMLLAVGFCCNLYAAQPNEVIPLWDNTDDVMQAIAFDGTAGTATATVYGKPGTTEIVGVLTVYKQTDAGWVYVSQDSRSTESQALSLSVDFDAESGVYYKALCRVTVTKGGSDEFVSQTVYETCP